VFIYICISSFMEKDRALNSVFQSEDKWSICALERNNKTRIELHFKFEAQFLLYKEYGFSLYFQGL